MQRPSARAIAIAAATAAVSVMAATGAAPPEAAAAPAAHTTRHQHQHPARHTAKDAVLRPAAKNRAPTHVDLTWKWVKSARYRFQLAPQKSFKHPAVDRFLTAAARRPSHGRQQVSVGKLADASRYYLRVRLEAGSATGRRPGPWSPPVMFVTPAHWPAPITDATAVAGPNPGETTISWSSDAAYTDYFRVQTSLRPFSTGGLNVTTFQVSSASRQLTLTAEQTAAAGAGIGSGHHLFFKVTAVRDGAAARQTRSWGHQGAATVAGLPAVGAGALLRVASYNIKDVHRDVEGHPWTKRQALVARNIAAFRPAVVALQEIVPAMWTGKGGGVGLQAQLAAAGAGQYRLTRDTTWASGTVVDARILFDPTQVEMVSICDSDRPSCGFLVPDYDGKPHVVSYAKFRELGTGQEFWFLSAHFNAGNDAKTDVMRGRQAVSADRQIRWLNTEGLPVIFGGDFNSSQVSAGTNAPTQALLDTGWYDTASAVAQVGQEYNTVNAYKGTAQQPSPWGFGSRIDEIMTLGMPGADRFETVVTGAPYPSDHNLVYADLRLP